MESEKETHEKEGGDGMKSENAESQADTPTDTGKDSTAEVKDSASDDIEETKGDAEEKKESESIAKEESMKVDVEASDDMPENGEKDKLQQSQTEDDKTNEVVAVNDTSGSKIDTEADGAKGDADSNSTAKESSLPVPSPLNEEPRIVTLEENDGKAEDKETMGEKDADMAENKESIAESEGGKESKDLVASEKTPEDSSSEPQQTETKLEAEQSSSVNETTVTESENNNSMGDQESSNPAKSSEETKGSVGGDSSEKDNAVANKGEDDTTKASLESAKVETNHNGGTADNRENTAMDIDTDLVVSSDVKAASDSVDKAPAPLNANKTITRVKPSVPPDAAYDDFRKKQSMKKKKKSTKRKQMKIKIAGMSTEETETKVADTGSSANPLLDKPDFAVSCHDSLIPQDYDFVEKELEDSLAFFEVPHEDQDPAYMEFTKKEKEDRIALVLKNLKVEEDLGKKTISQIVNQQLKEKQQSTERYVEARKQKIASKQKAQMTSLQQAYGTKARSNKSKIDQGLKLLRTRHAEENSKYLQQHRHQVRQRGLPEQMANAEWASIAQKLNARHTRQMQDFTTKGKEVMNKAKNEFESQRSRISQIATKEANELSAQRQSIYRRVYHTLQLTRQRHLRNHLRSIADRREAIKQELSSLEDVQAIETTEADPKQTISPEKTKSDTDEKPFLRSVSPIETTAEWVRESSHETSGAARRHQHRKTVLSQINRQLSVELHNEGIWLSELSETKNEQKSSDNAATMQMNKRHFFPWGIRARKILESIVCGEIPNVCDDSSKFNFSETVAQNGGHIRCLLTDLRTSDATASAQRAEAIMKKELDDVKKMEEKGTALRKNIAEQQKNVEIIRKQQRELTMKYKETAKEYEKTKQTYKEFRTKYGRYFGPDGKPLPTNDPNATRKLTEHNMKFKVAIENSHKRGSAIKNKITELQQSLQKRETSNKSDARTIQSLTAAIKSKRHVVNEVRSGRLKLLETKSIENPSNRVTNVINILSLTTDMRRNQLMQMRNNNNSSNWVQSLPGISNSMRRALWYKMHRRRQQIVLRPTFSSMVANMRKEIETKLKSIGTGHLSKEDKLITAEQTYLLASHPVKKMSENLSSLPSDSAWAEPGWYLKLDVEQNDGLGDRILPCHNVQPLVQHNLSELCSAPGRQASSMINSTHLRSLETPLSAVATASSFSETDPGMAKSADPILSSNDPLKMSRDALKSGYSFSMSKVASVKPSTATRRKSSGSKDTSSAVSSKGSKKKQSASASLDHGVSKIPGASTAGTSRVDNSRKRKTTAQSDPNSTPRAVQRKRVEPPRQKIPVDDQAFQPRPIMTQPQQSQQQQSQQPQQQPFMQQNMQQQQQNHYNNQFMNTMPSPVAPQQQATHRGSFNQFQNAPQMNQFRMMQQQQPHHHQQHSNQQNVNYGQMQQQPMRPNPQFFPQMGQQQFQQPMQMPGQGGMQMNLNNPVRQNMGSDEQNDPLFMLK